MPLLDRDAAWLCRLIYGYKGDPSCTWDHVDAGGDDGVAWSAKLDSDGTATIVFPGTENFRDGMRDFDFLPTKVTGKYAALGWVHTGFNMGLDNMVAELSARNPKRIRLTGHSYGAAHARLVWRRLLVDCLPAELPILFGEPASGFDSSPGRSYCNLDDPVCSLPPPLPLMPWTQGSELIPCAGQPVPWDNWGPLAPHRIQYYCVALQNCTASTP